MPYGNTKYKFKFTQYELAKVLGVSYSNMKRFCLDRGIVDVSKLGLDELYLFIKNNTKVDLFK